MLFRQSTAPRCLLSHQVSAMLVTLQQHMQSSEHEGSSTKHLCRWAMGTSTPPHSSTGTSAMGICHPVQTMEHSDKPRRTAQPTYPVWVQPCPPTAHQRPPPSPRVCSSPAKTHLLLCTLSPAPRELQLQEQLRPSDTIWTLPK